MSPRRKQRFDLYRSKLKSRSIEILKTWNIVYNVKESRQRLLCDDSGESHYLKTIAKKKWIVRFSKELEYY
jgi:hypothetical protein